MATLTIRRLDDGVYERLRARARSNKRSLEAEARDILTEQVQAPDVDAIIDELIAFHERMAVKHGTWPDSKPMLREMRETE
jgi:plasmid stability protein